MNSTYQLCHFLPALKRGDKKTLLFYCISFALYAGLSPLDRFLKGILLNDTRFPGGGDPGWYLNLVLDKEHADLPEEWVACIAQSSNPDAGCYEAWALYDTSGISPEMSYYSVEEVRHYIKLALNNIAEDNPESTEEVNEIISRFEL